MKVKCKFKLLVWVARPEHAGLGHSLVPQPCQTISAPPSFQSSPLTDSCDITEMTLGARSSGGGGCLHFFGLHVGTLRILHLVPLCVHPDDFP